MLIQRVRRASVRVDGETISQIEHGYVLLAGVAGTDSEREAEAMAKKIVNLRLFEDSEGTMNRSALDILDSGDGQVEMLLVSQFTLYADCRRGRRPSFAGAASPERAEPLVDTLGEKLRDAGIPVSSGQFGAMMEVEIINDGPVTIWLDSTELTRPKRAGKMSGQFEQGATGR